VTCNGLTIVLRYHTNQINQL